MFQTYTPSGSVSIKTFLTFCIGLVAAIILAFAYQFLLDWIPLIYVNFLLTFGVAIALGIIGSLVVWSGHCRNVWIGFVIGILLATSFLGAKFWFQYLNYSNQVREMIAAETRAEAGPGVAQSEIDKAVDEFLETEYSFVDHLNLRAAEGWQIGRAGNGGAPVSGIFVYLIWLIEAGMIFYYSVPATSSQASEPYSEQSTKWADEEEIVMSLPISDPAMVAKINSASSVEELLDIPIPKSDESNQIAFYQVNSIPGEEMEDAYLTVTFQEFTQNAKGEIDTLETVLVKNAILSTEKRTQLVENASLLQEALADYRAAVNEEAQQAPQAASADEEPPTA